MFNKFCRWLNSNRGPLVLEATALPTEPQPLPHVVNFIVSKANKSQIVKQEAKPTVILPFTKWVFSGPIVKQTWMSVFTWTVISVTRLGQFWKFLATFLLTKVAQKICQFLGYFWKRSLFVNAAVVSIFGQLSVTVGPHFYSNIWSHCQWL